MELQSIKTFLEVVRLGSFAAVARFRNVDPSSVSRTISTLEVELGFPLLHRTTRRLSLTEAGGRYHERVRKLVDQLSYAGEEARDLVAGPSGTLRVTACTSLGERVLAPLLPAFRERYPELVIELVLDDHQVDLAEEQIDVAIRFGTRPQGDFATTLLAPRAFYVCAAPEFLEQGGTPETPHDLSHVECLLFSTPGYRDVWKFRRPGEAAFEVQVSGHVRVSHGLTMTQCAVSGMGVAVLPDWLCEGELATGTLRRLFPEHECTATQFGSATWLIYPDNHYRALKVDAFVAHLRRHFTCTTEASESEGQHPS